MYKKIMLITFLLTLLNAEMMSPVVTENNLYKPSRLKHIKKKKEKLDDSFERNVVSKKEFIKEKRKKEKFQKELEQLHKKEEVEKRIKNNEKVVNEKKEEENKFQELLYLKQDTPMQRIAIYYNKDKSELYRQLVLYLVNDKQIGTLDDIKAVLNSRDDYLNFYEAIVKTMYQGYYESDYNKYLLRQMLLIYEKSYYKIKDTYMGLLLQDLFLSMGIIHPKAPIISSVSFCFTLEGKINQFACKMNQVQVLCLSGDAKMCNIYKEKMKFEYKEANLYLDKDLKLLSEVNAERKQRFEREAKRKKAKASK